MPRNLVLRFEWAAFVTDDLLARVAAETAVPIAVVQELRPVLARILDRAGGLPFVADEPSGDERTARGLALLAEAVAHAVAETGATHDATGYVTDEQGAERYARRIVALPRVNVNSADSGELTTLHGMTAGLASAVITERRRGGRYSSAEDFERRVNGIGPVKARAIAGALVFDGPHDTRRVALHERGDLGGNLRTLVAMQPDSDSSAALRRALDMVATACAGTPHPATRRNALRGPAPAAPSADRAAQWIGELWSDDYWKVLPELMMGAVRSIEVCMFHIAGPNEAHPTFRLLDGLRGAHQRGVAVRVLVDSDLKTDPYHSTVINFPAKKFLLEAGVECRSDLSNRLLHSKYLILDKEIVVLGSHNWSAGSYFGFDDLTLVIASSALAADLLARFESSWSHGH